MPTPFASPRLSHAQMYARLLAEDASCNGRFFTGVLTTGIYCLPSCKARKPKPENVRFFPSCEAAREAGLRACRKCHPDDFAKGADPVLESIEQLVAEIRQSPAVFTDVRSVVRRSGFSNTRLFELFRIHYHLTPADLLLRARLEHARQGLLRSRAPLTRLAGEAGFESLSSFHENFRLHNGLTPAAYREAMGARAFTLRLPEGYPLPYLRRALGRDPHSLSERLNGDLYTCAVRFSTGPTLLHLRFENDRIEVSWERGPGPEAHRLVKGLTGLGQNADGLARLAVKLGQPRLVQGREQLRISQTPSLFDGLLWSIIGQQINLPFACLLRRRLVKLCGEPVGEGLYACPTPASLASLNAEDLLPLQFSKQKADYLLCTARLISEGGLDLDALPQESATRVERRLMSLRGLGPWSVNYVLMRALGFSDCVPYGDTGLSSGLIALYDLKDKPDLETTRRLMLPFSPYRSLATNQLWQLRQPSP